MQSFQEGEFIYAFPDEMRVFRPQESAFYRKQWQRFAVPKTEEGKGNGEVDFVAFDATNRKVWLIEAKDFRNHPRTKTARLADEFAKKCRDTLSLLAACHLSRMVSDSDEKQAGLELSRMKEISCVLHVEQGNGSKLFPRVIDPKALHDSVRAALRALDPRAQAGAAAFLTGRTVPFGVSLG